MHDDHLSNLNKHTEFSTFRPAIYSKKIGILFALLLIASLFLGVTSLI